MNWKEEAVEKLKNYRFMRNATESIPQELEQLRAEAWAVQTGIGKLGGANIRSQEDRLMNNMVRRGDLEVQFQRAENWVRVTDSALAQLTDQERQMLTQMYIDGMDVMTVCRKMGVERSSLYRCRDVALRKLTLALYGAMES